MWSKLGLAFLAGGIAAGVVVYMGLQNRTPPRPLPPEAQATVAVPADPPAPAEPQAEPEQAIPTKGVSTRPAAAPARPRRASAAPPRRPQSLVETARVETPAQPPASTNPSVPAPVIASPAPARAPAPAAEPAPPPAPPARPAPPKREPKTVIVPAGSLITVRLRDTLSSQSQSTDDAFFATLDAPLIVDGMVLAERGAAVRGRVTESVASGRVKGRASLALQLDELNTADGQKVSIRTDTFRHEAESGVKGDAAKTGAAAGIGAVIGAIAGGGKGAAIGAVLGGAAGAGGAMATRGKPASLPSETRLTFRLSEPVTVTERIP